jgi:zinc finger BED domain-containing protein 5/7/8/9
MLILSNNTVSRRIEALSMDVKGQTTKAMQNSRRFAIQLDETTDIGNCAQLMVYVRYVGAEDIEEDFLFCHAMEGTTRGMDIMEMVDGYFQKEGISWIECEGVSTDDAPAMLGKKNGFTASHILETVCCCIKSS